MTRRWQIILIAALAVAAGRALVLPRHQDARRAAAAQPTTVGPVIEDGTAAVLQDMVNRPPPPASR